MASKKNILVVALIVLIQSVGLAQTTDWGWSWSDTSKVAVKNLPQQNEFLNNQYPYPAQPRSMWELGFGVGPSFIIGDVKSKVGIGGTISLRKAFSHTFSYRFNYTGMLNSGSPSVYGAAIGQYDYKNQTHSMGIDIIASLNPASHYRGNPKTDIYLFGGYALIGTKVLTKAPTGPFAQPGGYNQFYGIGNPNSQSGLVNTWFGKNINGRQGFSILHGISLGGGIAFKVDKRTNIGFEQKFIVTAPGYDYLDGFKGGNNNDFYSLTTFRVNVNIGNSAKRVEPLWWLNPNNYVYNELNSPKHMKLPPVVLPDADGDGVTDQFDLEPNTPKGCPVDTHGVSRDTDGDGVPDCRDKELLTPQNCFPVNSDGVGTCPEPACCKELRDKLANMGPTQANSNCNIGDLPSIQFKKGSTKLSKEAQATLAGVASRIKANPGCNVKVIGYGASSKAAQQMSWERVNAAIKYLTEKQGIAESRMVFTYGQDGDANTVDLQGTTETGPSNVPAPHPYIKK
ncbi:MAG: hypothetical protein NVSMB63_18490 [Sediminibacterium sp.]